MPSVRLLSSLLLLLWLLPSCSSSNDDDSPLVAQVYDRELHANDLAGIVPPGLSYEDSIAILDNYVDQWVRQAVILAKAEKNVKQDFSRELQEYKNNLLTYAYERQVLDQLLDTAVTEEQIRDYYEEHKGDFLLKSSIVKAVYVVAPAKAPAVAKLKKIVQRGKFEEKDILELEETASRNGFTGYYDADAWIPFRNLQATVPVTAYNEPAFLKQNRHIAFSDDSLFYAVRILSYKVSDEISPLEVQRENIRALILNHRKTEALNKLRSDLLKEAEDGGHVKRIKN